MVIREETAADRAAVYDIHHRAFGRTGEADLVDQLRNNAQPVISLVATLDETVRGHILFSPVTLDGNDSLQLMGLAPMAVAPASQNGGIGSALVEAGLAACRARGVAALAVLGHPNFYPRFGFKPASLFGIRSTYEVPDDVFMMMELIPGSMRNQSGMVRYHRAFESVD